MVTMQVENEYAPLIHEDATRAAAAADRPAGHGDRGRPGHGRRRQRSRRAHDPARQLERRTSTSTRSSPRSTATRAPTCGCCSPAAPRRSATKKKSEEFAAVLRRLEPTARDIAEINGALAKRRENLRRVITNFRLIAEELGRSDTQPRRVRLLPERRLRRLRRAEEANIRETLAELPRRPARDARAPCTPRRASRGTLEPGARRTCSPRRGRSRRRSREVQPFFAADRAGDPRADPPLHQGGRADRHRA